MFLGDVPSRGVGDFPRAVSIQQEIISRVCEPLEVRAESGRKDVAFQSSTIQTPAGIMLFRRDRIRPRPTPLLTGGQFLKVILLGCLLG